MQRSGLYVLCVLLCFVHNSEPQRYQAVKHAVRRRRSDERDGLALSREIFRNITKKLRENIKREGATEKTDRLLQNTLEQPRRFIPHQEYHHHEYHWGPYFEDQNMTQVTAHVGSEALMNCKVIMLKDKTIAWLRNSTDSAQLLTVGLAPYAGDSRISLKFQYPSNWRLSVTHVKQSDAGLYMCQISTHPPRIMYTNLTVLPPKITINGDQTHLLKDKFYKTGSSIKLSCIISEEYLPTLPLMLPVTTTPMPATSTTTMATTPTTTKMTTLFNRLDLMINKSWSVETTTVSTTVSLSTKPKITTEPPTTTELINTVTPTKIPMSDNIYGLIWKKQGKEIYDNISWRNISATIRVSSATVNDSGIYSCHLQNQSQVVIDVHVLIGENQAAVHHDTWNKGSLFWQPHIISTLSVPVIIILFQY